MSNQTTRPASAGDPTTEMLEALRDLARAGALASGVGGRPDPVLAAAIFDAVADLADLRRADLGGDPAHLDGVCVWLHRRIGMLPLHVAGRSRMLGAIEAFGVPGWPNAMPVLLAHEGRVAPPPHAGGTGMISSAVRTIGRVLAGRPS